MKNLDKIGIAHTLALLSMCLTVVAGCGDGSSMVPATGKLMVDGKPAEGAVILFHPEPSGTGKIGAAPVKEDGSFAISTDGKLGIPPGSYKLSLSWPDPSVKPTERQKMMGDFEPGPDLLKGKYVNKDKAKMQIEIKAGEKELAPIVISTK